MYCIAVNANLEYFFYHPSLFQKAGITDTPATWDDFFADCETMKNVGITPIASSGDTWYILRYAAMTRIV
jgi:raffinose/stachyose/melibiose transport system substrate-binding protein